MRDNGLTAAAYTSMGGIDPLVTEPVLTALAESGIAAYCGPPGEAEATGDPAAPDQADSGDPADQPATGEGQAEAPAEAPDKKTEAPEKKIPAGFEEIFVDAESVEAARGVIDRSTEDAEWASLVEQFNAPSAPGHDTPPVPRWPASEDVDDDSYEPLIDVPAGLIVGDADEDPPEEPPARRTDDPHDHYVPPEPTRGPRLDWITRAAWLGLLGGPLLLIVAAVFDFGTSRIQLLGVVGFIAGFLTLVIRMKDRLPPDDTPDDGAVV
ncbi:hypothetical protein FB561_4592 [Kribbella amoyensis]|uniref:DUF308 domain-containing protein n=1 Tax=Kribbella amoyensis TaxID=996641 RepID=A0A561BX24_9ACTN|nr:hypothetical protein [Kribbella amoyensis]TWD83429.1 hypothetical protein FB561_4592 [Kribbella amoyensis]